MTNEFFQELARRFEAAGITAEAVEDAKGLPCSLRFYVDGRAFEIRPEQVEGERLRLAIDSYEAEEPDMPEEQLEHVIEVIERTELASCPIS